MEEGMKRKREDDEEEEEVVAGLRAPCPAAKSNRDGGVVFVLSKASLEVGKVGKIYQLLNSEDHAHFLRKNKQNPAAYRPDIVHQALLMILDSPVNKTGRLSAIYVQTQKNILIKVNPHVRLPRTFKRFCGLMVQLLQKLSIRATNGPDILLRVIKNPVTKYLPSEARRIGLSYSASKVVQLRDYVDAVRDNVPLVFVVGAMSHGKIDADYVDDFISISQYPLCAALCIAHICEKIEWK